MKHIEENLQISCIRYLRLQYPSLLAHHSPNGGKRSLSEGARFKRMGTLAGFPDIFIYKPTKSFHGLAIELKTDKGKQTESQKQMQGALIENGYRYEIVRSIEEFIYIVNSYLCEK